MDLSHEKRVKDDTFGMFIKTEHGHLRINLAHEQHQDLTRKSGHGSAGEPRATLVTPFDWWQILPLTLPDCNALGQRWEWVMFSYTQSCG
jgi:hypothetical protein